jgi:hypothetical protein
MDRSPLATSAETSDNRIAGTEALAGEVQSERADPEQIHDVD